MLVWEIKTGKEKLKKQYNKRKMGLIVGLMHIGLTLAQEMKC
jgi:hypothetical protein